MKQTMQLISFAILLLATGTHAAAIPQKLVLDPAGGELPEVTVLSQESTGLTLAFDLPALTQEEIVVEDRLYQVLTLQGGEMRGLPGRAGLPTYTCLLAVPDGAAVRARVLARSESYFEGYRLFPVQPEDADRFILDLGYYQGLTEREKAPAVIVGDPVIFRDLRVVPVTFSPVDFDPANGSLNAAHHIEVELDFSGSDERNAVPVPRSLIPESFDRLYAETVVNYERSDNVAVGPGTYLIIYPDDSEVLNRIQALINWRERMGYNVIVASTAQTGTVNTSIKNYIQNVYDTSDPPLEFICLVGDAFGAYRIPCWFELLSGFTNEGDHYYTNLEGD